MKPISRRGSHAEGTESTVSTTAPSTVWEELSSLRSRLNRLELTGKLIDSGNGGGFRERPSTATTTVTTMSSPPRHEKLRSGSVQASTVTGAAKQNIHPLLDSALERSKSTVSPKVFQALETTASDALALAAMTREAEVNVDIDRVSITSGATTAIDRPLRHKADSLCRSLTELCIALSDPNDLEVRKARPGSRDTSRPIQTNGWKMGDVRTTSQEPEQERVSSRAMSRFEARRSSMQALNTTYNGRDSSPFEPTATPNHQQQPTTSSASRPPSVLLRRRTEDGERPLSRAMTQVSHTSQRPLPNERLNREYTSHHPLPSSAQRSPSFSQPYLSARATSQHLNGHRRHRARRRAQDDTWTTRRRLLRVRTRDWRRLGSSG